MESGIESPCQCCKSCANAGFQKLVELLDSGFVIYRYKDQPDDNGPKDANINRNEDVFIFQNKKDEKVDKNVINDALGLLKPVCPRCRKIFEQMQKLTDQVPPINKKMVIGICDHCKARDEAFRKLCKCDIITKKFISIEQIDLKKVPLSDNNTEYKRILFDKKINKGEHSKVDIFEFLETDKSEKPSTVPEPNIEKLISSKVHLPISQDIYDSKILDKKERVKKVKQSLHETVVTPLSNYSLISQATIDSKMLDKKERVKRIKQSLHENVNTPVSEHSLMSQYVTDSKTLDKTERVKKIKATLHDNVVPPSAGLLPTTHHMPDFKKIGKKPTLKKPKESLQEIVVPPLSDNESIQFDSDTGFIYYFPTKSIERKGSIAVSSTELITKTKEKIQERELHEQIKKDKLLEEKLLAEKLRKEKKLEEKLKQEKILEEQLAKEREEMLAQELKDQDVPRRHKRKGKETYSEISDIKDSKKRRDGKDKESSSKHRIHKETPQSASKTTSKDGKEWKGRSKEKVKEKDSHDFFKDKEKASKKEGYDGTQKKSDGKLKDGKESDGKPKEGKESDGKLKEGKESDGKLKEGKESDDKFKHDKEKYGEEKYDRERDFGQKDGGDKDTRTGTKGDFKDGKTDEAGDKAGGKVDKDKLKDEKKEKDAAKLASDNVKSLLAEEGKSRDRDLKKIKQEEETERKFQELAEKAVLVEGPPNIEDKMRRESSGRKLPDLPDAEPKSPPEFDPKRNVRKLDIKHVKVKERSTDDLIMKLVHVNAKPKHLSDINIPPLKFLDADKGGLQQFDDCVLCGSTVDLEDLEILKSTKPKEVDETKNIIIGTKLYKYKPPLKTTTQKEAQIVPMLFKTNFEESIVNGLDEKTSEMVEPPDLKIVDQDPNKGVIRYALSDRTFIDKGWTLLPTEKIVRKMNVYRMRPAHPEFDWFEHNKHKGLITYATGERMAEFYEDGRGRWYYQNGRLALDYYYAEDMNAQQRYVIYSNGEPDENGRFRPITVLATFDHLGNGVVFDHAGKIRLKYNQTEGVVLDRSLGPTSHWKWHTLNDPPVLQQVMIDTQFSFRNPDIIKLGPSTVDEKYQPDNDEMLAIEFDNFVKEKSKKLSQKFKPFQIKMKALKLNENFSLKVLDQASIYLIFQDGSANVKLNLGMILDDKEIIDTETSQLGEITTPMDMLPARTDSISGLQCHVNNAVRLERKAMEKDRRLKISHSIVTVDKLKANISKPLRLPAIPPGSSYTSATNIYKCRCPFTNNVYRNTSLI